MTNWPSESLDLLAPEVDVAEARALFAVRRRRRRTRRRIGLGASMFILLGCGILVPVVFEGQRSGPGSTGVVSSGSGEGRQSHQTPQEVALAYIATINSEDLSEARTYMTERFADRVASSPDGWFSENVVRLANVEIGEPEPHILDQDDPLSGEYEDVVYVPVRFDLEQRAEVSMVSGPTRWGYIMARQDSELPWKIVSDGV